MENDKESKKRFSDFVKENGGSVGKPMHPLNYEKRVMDMFESKKELLPHLQNYMQHCIAKKVNPSLEVVIDWLYSEKGILEKDEFVPIDRCKEMVIEGNVFPSIIVEVLEYASAVEAAAKKVVEDMSSIYGLDSLDELRDSLGKRLKDISKPSADKKEN